MGPGYSPYPPTTWETEISAHWNCSKTASTQSSSLKGFKIKNSTRQVHWFHFIDHKARGLNELHGHTASAGSTEKNTNPICYSTPGQQKIIKVFRERGPEMWSILTTESWPRMRFSSPDAWSSSCHSQAQAAARLICKTPPLPGRSLSHGFQNRILDEASIHLKLHFLTNSNPNSKLTNLAL